MPLAKTKKGRKQTFKSLKGSQLAKALKLGGRVSLRAVCGLPGKKK